MKKLYTLFIGVLLGCAVYAQTFQHTPISEQKEVKKCATAEVLEGMRRLNPAGETDQQFESWLQEKIRERSLEGARVHAIVTIPVVFHIIHTGQAVGTGSNISAAAVQQQLMQLNKDFANLSGSPYAVAADMEIRFALATTDPFGTLLAEPGIDRVNANTGGFGLPPYTVGYANPANNALNNSVKPATIWDPNRFLNIWALDMEAGILGIATFPASSTLAGLNNSETVNTAGVAVGPSTLGSEFIPTGGCGQSYGRGRTLTHELGHFFGLRHIWGDATCGTDYCGDTPTHQTDNAGVPTHPKPNSCGTADEMFENYMDYCDDVALNTFTNDQKTRMQTVLLNSPRRGSLTASTVPVVDPVANRIQFNPCLGAVTIAETGAAGTYPRYRDTSFVIMVENKATAAATVTVTTGGTAVSGYHYQLVTPSVTFAAGDVKKTITVRIFDNAEVDASRTLILGFSISGTGVQAGSSFQTQTITITDDDNVTPSQNLITLLSQDFESSLAGWNLLSTGGMPNLWVASNTGNAGGTGNCAFISNTTASPYANSYTKTVAGLAVLRSPLVNAAGYSGLQLSFKFRVWGEVIGTTAYDYGMAAYLTTAAPTTSVRIPGSPIYAGTTSAVSGTSTLPLPDATFANTSFYLGFLWNNDDGDGNDPAFNIDDIVLTAQGTSIETVVGNSYGFDVRSGTNNLFRSTAGRVIASVNNLNSNLTNFTAYVTQSGTALVPLTTTVGSYSRSSKVIRLAPASANTSVTYQVTLYFTTAELADWGVNVPNLKILKVKDGVNLSNVIQGSDGQLGTGTVFNDFRSTRGYASFTANFTGGFSQFALVSPATVLPVNLISFEARARSTDIQLTWATSQETNNRGFAIERSADGNNFERIGWVDGNGTTSARSDYAYTDTDVQPGVLYYYRLRQTDLDNREKLSEIRTARIDQNGIAVSLRPNPASGKVYLTVTGSNTPADISLVNSLGQVVRRWNGVTTSGNRTELDISGLSSGLYHLEIRSGDQEHREKLLIR